MGRGRRASRRAGRVSGLGSGTHRGFRNALLAASGARESVSNPGRRGQPQQQVARCGGAKIAAAPIRGSRPLVSAACGPFPSGRRRRRSSAGGAGAGARPPSRGGWRRRGEGERMEERWLAGADRGSAGRGARDAGGRAVWRGAGRGCRTGCGAGGAPASSRGSLAGGNTSQPLGLPPPAAPRRLTHTHSYRAGSRSRRTQQRARAASVCVGRMATVSARWFLGRFPLPDPLSPAREMNPKYMDF